MPETNFDAVVVGVKYTCDVCGIGDMGYTGNFKVTTDCIINTHVCNHCGENQDFKDIKYPTVRFESVVKNDEPTLEERVAELEKRLDFTPGTN